MAKYIDIPFAANGNKNAIPDTTTDGTVNYNDGFGADYAKPIGTDPAAKSVDRQTINQVLYDYGSAIQQLQENGFYPWQSTKAGGYDIGAVVSYSGANYINTVAGNTNAPDVSGWTQYANINGNNAQAFKVANASNADEALSMGQLVNVTALAGSNTDLVRGLPADFTSSKAANGYQKLPSGVIIQWGTVSVSVNANTATSYSFTFPIAFPNTCIIAYSTQGNYVTSSSTVENQTTTSCNGYCYFNSAKTLVINIYAIGY